jgi:hypothetical protein
VPLGLYYTGWIRGNNEECRKVKNDMRNSINTWTEEQEIKAKASSASSENWVGEKKNGKYENFCVCCTNKLILSRIWVTSLINNGFWIR